MSDRYISQHPKPTPYQREILTIVMEEAAEIIQAASKILRFGLGDGYPGTDRTNTQDLAKEIGELNYLVVLAKEAGLVTQAEINYGAARKVEKLATFMQEQP